jgi:hypothetical protein
MATTSGAHMAIRVKGRLEKDLAPGPLSLRHGRACPHSYQDQRRPKKDLAAQAVASPSWPSPGLSGGSSGPSVAARAGRDGPDKPSHDDAGKILLCPPPYPDTHGVYHGHPPPTVEAQMGGTASDHDGREKILLRPTSYSHAAGLDGPVRFRGIATHPVCPDRRPVPLGPAPGNHQR